MNVVIVIVVTLFVAYVLSESQAITHITNGVKEMFVKKDTGVGFLDGITNTSLTQEEIQEFRKFLTTLDEDIVVVQESSS